MAAGFQEGKRDIAGSLKAELGGKSWDTTSANSLGQSKSQGQPRGRENRFRLLIDGVMCVSMD